MKTKTTLYAGLAALGLTFWLGTPPALAFVTVTVQPANQVVLVGSNAVFSAQVSATAGETITGYTWQMSANGQTPLHHHCRRHHRHLHSDQRPDERCGLLFRDGDL